MPASEDTSPCQEPACSSSSGSRSPADATLLTKTRGSRVHNLTVDTQSGSPASISSAEQTPMAPTPNTVTGECGSRLLPAPKFPVLSPSFGSPTFGSNGQDRIVGDPGRPFSLIFKDPLLRSLFLRCLWVPHGNNVRPTLLFPSQIIAGDTLRLAVDLMTTTLPRFGMTIAATIFPASANAALKPIPGSHCVAMAQCNSLPYSRDGQLRGFQHRALMLLRIPASIDVSELYCLQLSMDLLTEPGDGSSLFPPSCSPSQSCCSGAVPPASAAPAPATSKPHLRFVSCPFRIFLACPQCPQFPPSSSSSLSSSSSSSSSESLLAEADKPPERHDESTVHSVVDRAVYRTKKRLRIECARDETNLVDDDEEALELASELKRTRF